MTDSVFDPRAEGFLIRVQDIRDDYSSLLMGNLIGMNDDNFIAVLRARQLLDRLYVDLGKYSCNFEEIVAKTCGLGDTTEFWDNLAIIGVGIKSKRAIASDDIKKRIVNCKLNAMKFIVGEIEGVSDTETFIKDFGIVLHAVLKDLRVTDWLVQVGERNWFRQLTDYYSDLITDVSIEDVLILDELCPSVLAGLSSAKRQELMLWIENYFRGCSDDDIADQFSRSLINYVLSKQLHCENFDKLLNSVKEKIEIAAGYGIHIREKQYVDYALGQVKQRMFV